MCVLLQEVRLKEGIVRLQPQEEPLRSELLSGKFTVLVGAAAIPGGNNIPTREQHSQPCVRLRAAVLQRHLLGLLLI